MRIFEINTESERDAFYKILIILQEMLGIQRSAMKIYADLLYYNWKFRNVSEKDRDKLIFSYDTFLDIAEHHGMSENVLRNGITYLRKKKILVKRTFADGYRIGLDDYSNILFKIKGKWQS